MKIKVTAETDQTKTIKLIFLTSLLSISAAPINNILVPFYFTVQHREFSFWC